MKLISWNCRGTNNAAFRRNCHELLNLHRPDAICLIETKASSREPPRFLSKLGFTENYQVPSTGLAGGIWLFWNPVSIIISVIESESQLIHCHLLQGNNELNATFAYIQPSTEKKREFWSQAEEISRTTLGPWILIGDLNDIAFESERAPQRNGSTTSSLRFREHIQDCDLIDMESSGCKFTWIREQHGRII